jgi:hypothetical protein
LIETWAKSSLSRISCTLLKGDSSASRPNEFL